MFKRQETERREAGMISTTIRDETDVELQRAGSAVERRVLEVCVDVGVGVGRGMGRGELPRRTYPTSQRAVVHTCLQQQAMRQSAANPLSYPLSTEGEGRVYGCVRVCSGPEDAKQSKVKPAETDGRTIPGRRATSTSTTLALDP